MKKNNGIGAWCIAASAAVLQPGCATTKTPPQVMEVDRLEAEVTAGTLHVRRQAERAWVEDVERDAGAATLVQKFGKDQYVQGMTISPRADYLVFSLLEPREPSKDASENKKEKELTEKAAPELPKTLATLRALMFGSAGVTQITTGRSYDLFPSFGQDAFITFSSNRLRRTGSDVFRISSQYAGGVSVIYQAQEAASFHPSVSGDGTMVYSLLSKTSAKEAPQIWALGGKVSFPTELQEGYMPAVSPDGSQIAFIGDDGQLWAMAITGKNPTQLTSSPIPKDDSGRPLPKRHPAWSPDSTQIVFAAADGRDANNKPNYDIWIIENDGSHAQQLTTNGSLDIYPVVSPSQKFIYFVSNRGFTEGIWRIPYPASEEVKPAIATEPLQSAPVAPGLSPVAPDAQPAATEPAPANPATPQPAAAVPEAAPAAPPVETTHAN